MSFSYAEQVFGMSRGFIPVLAEVVTFISRALHGSARISEVAQGGDSEEADLTTECHRYYNVLETWVDDRDHQISARVHTGNNIYKKTAQILLLRDVLKASATDPIVKSCSDAIVSMLAECTTSKMGVDLIWPAIVASSHAFGSSRARATRIFSEFRSQCCFEVDSAEQIVQEVWRRLDEGLPNADWRSVMKDSQTSLLLL